MATTYPNPLTSYDLTVETPINIDELIKLLNYDDLPMLGGVNADGMPTIPKAPVDNRVFYWLEEDMPVPRSTVGTALATTVTSLVLATGGGASFAAGDAVRVNDEVLFVSAVSTDTLTVSRGDAGTSDPGVNHAVGAEVVGLGTVLAEGSIGDQQFRGRDKYSNYTQIFSSKIQITRTEQGVPKYGIPSELARQVRATMLSEGINQEQAFLYGVKYDDGAAIRATGGLANFITTNVQAGTTYFLTIGEVEDKQQISYDAGGMFHQLVSRPVNFAALNNSAGSERIQTVTIGDDVRGRRRAQTVLTEFGEVELVRNRHCQANDAFGINREDIIERVFQPMIMQPLAKTDDKDNYMFVSEIGFEVKGQSHMHRWSALDATQTFPTTGLV